MKIVEQEISSVKKIRVTVSPSDDQIRLKMHPENPMREFALNVCRMIEPELTEFEVTLRGNIGFNRGGDVLVYLAHDSGKVKFVRMIKVNKDL